MKTYTIISSREGYPTNVSAPFSDPEAALKVAERWEGHASEEWEWVIQEATLDKPVSTVAISLERFRRELRANERPRLESNPKAEKLKSRLLR